MVKKDKKPRKTTLAAPATEEGETPLLGWVAIAVQLVVNVPATSPFDELVVELGCLGLVEEPDEIQALNAPALDPKRPITSDAEGVHIYFSTPQTAGSYGLQLQCKYNDAVIGRTAAPPADVATPKYEAA